MILSFLKSRLTSLIVESKKGISILVISSFPFIFGLKDVPLRTRSDVKTPCFINGFLNIMLNIFASVGLCVLTLKLLNPTLLSLKSCIVPDAFSCGVTKGLLFWESIILSYCKLLIFILSGE